MTIERVIIKNYRTLRSTDISFKKGLNIIVGDNETGKSTLLEAINLALKCQLNRRSASQELHHYLINTEAVQEFIKSHQCGNFTPPPQILIEIYFADNPEIAELKGTNNSERANVPGIRMCIELDDQFIDEFREYVSNPSELKSVPIEYYYCNWRTFADDQVSVRNISFLSALIDPSSISNVYSANKYLLEIVRDYLTKKQRVDLSLSYRHMRDVFLEDKAVRSINHELAKNTGLVSDKVLSVAMDTTSKASWENSVLPHLNDIPMTMIGKGEQNSIKIKLAIAAESQTNLLLLEEPENHLSHSNLNRLIDHIQKYISSRQLIITTHSSFVLNKLGIDHVLLFNGKVAITLNELSNETRNYFMKLPSHDTLRMVLAKRTVLVEGPSDELIVQKAYYQKHGKSALEDGVEIITVNSLAFKRFLEVAKRIDKHVHVVTDNDGNVDKIRKKYQEFDGSEKISICYDLDESLCTLELQLLKSNGRNKLNEILAMNFTDDHSLISYMLSNKTKVALQIFESEIDFNVPSYIEYAIQ